MAYKPKNVTTKYGIGKDYREGSAIGKGGGVVPGSTNTDDRGSQDPKMEFYNDGNTSQGSGDMSFFDGDGLNNKLDPRKNENFGKASYRYAKPTL